MTTEILLSENDFSPVQPDTDGTYMEVGENVRLFIRHFKPAGIPRATVIITHGLGEHSNRYGHVAAALVGRGWEVIAWDLRGHGRSPGGRGDIEDYQLLVDDLGAVVARYRVAGRPLFLFAHSMGGQITLRYLQTVVPDCQGAIIAAPWLRLAFDPPRWKLVLARIAMRIWPSFTQNTGNRWERLSRDLAHMSSFPDLDLVHHGISARMYFAVREAGEKAIASASELRLPLLLVHGDADPVTSHHSTCEFFEHAGSADKTLRILPGSRHETHNDLDREQVIREIVAWIESRVTPPEEGVKGAQ